MSTGRVALVTGGAVRLGRAIAEGLARAGYHLAIHYNRSQDAARDTVAAVQSLGSDAAAIPGDLVDADACAGVVARAIAHFGALDVVVNSAASFSKTPLGETDSSDWDSVVALNLRAPFLVTQAAAPHMRQGGSVVNIADLAGLQSWPSYHAHGAAKAALIHLTRSLARTLGPTLRVNAIAPGAVLLPEDFSESAASRLVAQTPLRRLGEAQDIVNAVRYLIEADFVTGSLVVVDGGRMAR